MSIKTLFEDIADAIREKSGSSDTYTPAEMPSAIRSIPSGSSTASGVSYDNTASGLTANNVQDAIDELAGDVSTINSDLSELHNNDFETTVTLTNGGYTEANPYVFPSDGYLSVGAVSTGAYYVFLQGSTSSTKFGFCGYYFSGGNQAPLAPVFVRKGMKCWKDSNNTQYYFTPIDS